MTIRKQIARHVAPRLTCSLAIGLLAGATLIAAAGAPVQAQSGPMFNQPYSFPATNRANNAVVMKQVESGLYSRGANSTTTAAAGSSTVLVCGGGGGGSETSAASGATGNSSCIILNNSTGGLSIGQDSAGSQNANTNTTATDEVSNALANNPATSN